MSDGMWITDEEIEQGFRANGWNGFFRPRERYWVLPFQNPDRVVGYQVHLENGLVNENFIGVRIVLLQAQRNQDCLHKALSLMNGQLGVVKFVIEDGAVVVRTAFPRRRALFTPEKLRQTLQNAVEGVLMGAEFARPILECCVQDKNCDPEEAFRRRMTELGQGGPGPGLAPPPER